MLALKVHIPPDLIIDSHTAAAAGGMTDVPNNSQGGERDYAELTRRGWL